MIKLLFNNSKKVLKISVNLSWLLVSEIYKNISFNFSKADEFKAKSLIFALELNTNNW